MQFATLPLLPGNAFPFFEEFNANLAIACQVALQNIESTKNSDPGPRANGFLQMGIILLMQGNIVNARANFRKAKLIVPHDEAFQDRVLRYESVATYYLLPSGPDGAMLPTVRSQASMERPTTIRTPQIQRDVLSAEHQIEAIWLEDVIRYLSELRYVTSVNYLTPIQERFPQLQRWLYRLEQAQQDLESIEAHPSLIAQIDFWMADLCARARFEKHAHSYLLQAHNRYESVGDTAGKAQCYMLLGDWKCASLSTPVIWNQAIQEGDWNNTLSEFRENQEFQIESPVQIVEAEEIYIQAEHFFRETGSGVRGIAHIQLRLSYLRALTHNYQDVMTYAQQASRLFLESGDFLNYQLAQAHILIGQVMQNQQPFATAREIGYWGHKNGSTHFCLGTGLFITRVARRLVVRESQYEYALTCYKLSRELFNALELKENVAQNLADQGMVYKTLGDYTTAAAFVEEAIELLLHLLEENPPHSKALAQKILMAVDELLILYIQMPDGNRAMVRGVERLEQRIASVDIYHGHDMFGPNYQNTLKGLVEHRQELMAVTSKIIESHTLRNQGFLYESDRILEDALLVTAQTTTANSIFMQATILRHLRRFDEASVIFQQFVARGGFDANFTGDVISQLTHEFGEIGILLAREQEIKTHIFAFNFFVKAYDYTNAASHRIWLESLVGADWYRLGDTIENLTLLAEFYRGEGDFTKALKYCDDAIALFESKRIMVRQEHLRISLAGTSTIQSLYFHATQIAYSLGQERPIERQLWIERALEYSERGRARAFLDMLATSSLTQIPAIIDRQRALNARLSQYRQLYASAVSRAEPVTSLVQRYKDYIHQDEVALSEIIEDLSTHVHSQLISVTEAYQFLPIHTLLIEYFYFEDTLYIFAISGKNHTTEIYEVPIQRGILNLYIRQFMLACTSRTPVNGMQLVKVLLEPLQDAINAHERLTIVPYQMLHQLPFQALPWGTGYLIDSHILNYLPSISALQFLQEPTIADDLLDGVVVANPSGMRYIDPENLQVQALFSLPYAEKEAQSVYAQFKSAKLFLRDKATKATILHHIREAKFIHIASHGVISRRVPLLSTILLAEGENVSVDELLGTRLKAEIFILSACNTAQGNPTLGEDVMGFTQGVLAAGAHSVIVAQWPIDDEATSLLMASFYRNLTKMDPALALHHAQQEIKSLEKQGTLKERRIFDPESTSSNNTIYGYQSPYYWAAFRYIGV
jgi:CHAT domain-containing protein